MKKLLILSLACLLVGLACSKEDDPSSDFDCTGVTPTYTTNIKAILDANCATSGCHDAVTKEDGKDFSTYASAKTLSQESAFLGAIQHKSGFEPMPQGSDKLSDATIKLLGCWVQNGSPQ